MLTEMLNDIRKDQLVVEFQFNSITDRPYIGQVRNLSEEMIQITEYDQFGAFEGVLFTYLEYISDIFVGGARVAQIVDREMAKTHFEIPQFEIEDIDNLIEDLGNRGELVEFCRHSTGGGSVVGKVLAFDEEWVKIDGYSSTELSKHIGLFEKSDITMVRIGSSYLKQVKEFFDGGSLTSE